MVLKHYDFNDDEDVGIIIEIKYADENIEAVRLKVLNYSNVNQYVKNLRQAGIRTILK